ncbi:MAG: glycosyltransferase, partial [Dehalococcoidia bacterium]
IRLLPLEHRGKGWAVKHGVLASTGQHRFICDADLSMPFEQVERFLPPQVEGVDIIIGSREMSNSRRIGEPVRRHLMGRFYNLLIQLLAIKGVQDTQCGFKCFRGAIAAPLFQQQTLDGFAFDVELLYIARRSGLSMREIGIDWRYRGHSKVRTFRDSFIMTWDLLKIRWRHRGGQPPISREER